MKDWHKVIIGIICFFALIFTINEFNIFGIKFWGVRTENARREVFEQTQSYVEGKRQDLIKYHHEWNKASPDDKIAIETVIRQQFANFNEDRYLNEQPELQSFLKTVKYK